jgi:hypothetical protein
MMVGYWNFVATMSANDCFIGKKKYITTRTNRREEQIYNGLEHGRKDLFIKI